MNDVQNYICGGYAYYRYKGFYFDNVTHVVLIFCKPFMAILLFVALQKM